MLFDLTGTANYRALACGDLSEISAGYLEEDPPSTSFILCKRLNLQVGSSVVLQYEVVRV
jgi:hypothetical protein